MHVIAREVTSDAHQPRSVPEDLGRRRRPKPVTDQVLELAVVIHQQHSSSMSLRGAAHEVAEALAWQDRAHPASAPCSAV